MKKIDFLIFYEHKNREFESIVLLKHELVKRDFTVEFCSFYENNYRKRKALFNNVNIAVMPSLYHDEEILNYVYRVAGKVKNIVNLRWEQIFPKDTEQNLDYYVYPKDNAKLGYHCCWGQKPYEMLQEVGVEEDKLFITGPIQMDFVRDHFRNLYFSKSDLFSQYDIDMNKNCILFTSSFAISSLDKWGLEWFFSQYHGEEKEYYQMYLAHEIESRNTIVEWLKRMAKEKDCTIVYRPHPAEAKTELVESLKKVKNIKVIAECNIKQWILVCDQVYTWNSTSIAEASIAKVPCAVLRPVKLEECEEYSIYEGIPYITSYKQLSDYYDTNSSDLSTQLVDDRQLKHYLSVDPLNPSYIRTADVLEKSLHDDYYFPWSNFPEDSIQYEEKRIHKQKVQDALAYMIVKPVYKTCFLKKVVSRLFPKLSFRYGEIVGNKDRIISDKEIKEEENRISSILFTS